MRIYLVSPTHYQKDGSLYKTPRYWTSALTLAYLKALTPREHEVRLVDELCGDVDLDWDCDLVGITAMGPQIKRAYELGDAFRARGRKVVLGGTWVSLAPPEKSLAHADAIVVREADTVWPNVLADAAAGTLKPTYQANGWIDLKGMTEIDYRDLPLLSWESFRRNPLYRVYFHWPLIFSRGCPLPCSYCAVQSYYKRTFRTRPVDEVIENVRRIRALGGRKLLFLDDNPIADVDAAKELFRALIPYKMKWASQCTIDIARDPELLDLATRSGCVLLSIGLESLRDEVLQRVKKGFNRPKRFAEDLRVLRARGIHVIALMMVGLDGEDPAIFRETLDFLVQNKVSLLKLFTPAPYPGTEYHAKMEKEGRIHTEDWGQYDYGGVIVQPTGMSASELQAGFQRTYRSFYSLPNIARRLFPLPPRNFVETAANLVANLKVNRYLARRPEMWGTIS